MNLFDVVPTLEKITLNDVQSLAAEVISEERFSVCQVVPEKEISDEASLAGAFSTFDKIKGSH